ncbi:MAG: hypothetical protein ACTSUE_20050 [Promethearchaeota archaeon]
MNGARLPETFGGDFSYSQAEANIPSDKAMYEDETPASGSYGDYNAEAERRQGSESGYESGISDAPPAYGRISSEDTGYISSSAVQDSRELYEDVGYDQDVYDEYVDVSASEGGTMEAFSPPIGYWNNSSDFATQQHLIKKMILNRSNVFDLESHIEYKLADGSKTKWNLADEWGKDGKNTPYAYSGSPFTGDRVISRIWLMEASHNGMVSQTLHFSMPNSLTEMEMFKPIIPVLVRTHDEGPTHVVIRPGDKLETPIPLWYKDVTSRRSPVIENNPGVTEEHLREELMMNSNPRERRHVKNLAAGSSILLKYIQDKINNENFEDRLVPVLSEGYYKIPNAEAESFIRLWKIDQSRDLTVKHLYNLTVKPNRSVRSPKDSSSFHEDPFQDKAEIMSKMDNWSLGEAAEEKTFSDKVIRERPITVYWKIRVELVPVSKAGH